MSRSVYACALSNVISYPDCRSNGSWACMLSFVFWTYDRTDYCMVSQCLQPIELNASESVGCFSIWVCVERHWCIAHTRHHFIYLLVEPDIFRSGPKEQVSKFCLKPDVPSSFIVNWHSFAFLLFLLNAFACLVLEGFKASSGTI